MVFARMVNLVRRSASSWLPRAYSGMLNRLCGLGNLVISPRCSFCGGEIPETPSFGPRICVACRVGFVSPSVAVCHRCASPLPLHWRDPSGCPKCRNRSYQVERTVAIGVYRSTLRDAVLCMKRAEFEPLTHVMAELLAEQLLALGEETRTADYIVPTPMHWLRRLRRGVHPARILAAGIARRLSVPLVPGLLRCRHRTRKQGTLTPAQRFRNVHGAYRAVAGYDLTNKHIVVVDDVMTTGATLNELARILKRAGAAEVTAAVVARGIGH